MNVLKINSSLFNKTPLLRHTFKKNSGPKILLKYEFLQPSGSFKSRGIGHLISKRVEELYKRKPGIQGHVFASSGGNAGLAAAVASSELQIPCTVVVSKATRPRLVEKNKILRGTGNCLWETLERSRYLHERELNEAG